MVASTQWDFHVLKTEGLTQKYIFRTFDENILAPLVSSISSYISNADDSASSTLAWCVIRLDIVFVADGQIDFEGKKGEGEYKLRYSTDDVDDMITSSYGDAVGTYLPLPVECH